MVNRIITASVSGETIKLSNKLAGAAGSFNAVSLAFTFDSAWDGTTKKVYFIDRNGANAVYILLTSNLLINGAYVVPIPAEPLVYAGEMTVTIKGVDFATDGTTAERIVMSASTTMKVSESNSPVSGTVPQEPTPTQAEQLLASVNSVTGMTVSATALTTGEPATVTKTTNTDDTINLAFGLPAGGKGDTGSTGAIGATGNGISSVVLNGDYTLTINYTSGSSVTTTSIRGATGATGAKGDTGATGKGISSVVLQSGTHAAGTTDTYRITFTDATTFDFGVYNGANGSGAGDMLASVYDPNSKNADSFNMANMVEGTTNKILSATERTKLSGIATGATANDTDANLKNRANHTGTQLKSTISDFPTTMTPSSHVHGNITNDGKIGSTADLPIFTGTAGALVAKTIADTKTLLGITDNSYVKLLNITVGTAAAAVTLDLSALGTANYRKLEILISGECSATSSVNITINGNTATNYVSSSIGSSGTNTAYIAQPTFDGSVFDNYVLDLMYNGSNTTTAQNITGVLLGAQGNYPTNIFGRLPITLTSSAITSVTFTAQSGTIAIGSKFSVYGVKA